MAEFPAMPLYTDALLADCGHLSDAEFGLYVRLLIQMWRSPTRDGTLPDDDDWLARRLHKTTEGIQSQLRPLIAEFCIRVAGKRLTQRRLQRELVHAHEYRKKQSDRAKRMWEQKNQTKVGITAADAISGIGLGNAGLAKHPTPIKENNILVQSPTPPEEKKGAAGMEQTTGSETIPVSPALAAKFTKPKPRDDFSDLEIPEILRRTA
jgi:uncharacterized protein YdaU (DUF1376 family)